MAAAVVLALDNRASLAAIRRLKDRAPIAIARALNRSVDSGRTAMTRKIAEDLSTKVGVVRERIYVVKATVRNHVAEIRASAKRIPLVDFGARGPLPSRGRGRVTAKLQGKREYPRAFMARMPSGHLGVFVRGGKGAPEALRRGPKPNRSQLPIRELFGPSVAHVFLKHLEFALARSREQLVKNLQHEFRYELLNAA